MDEAEVEEIAGVGGVCGDGFDKLGGEIDEAHCVGTFE